MRGPTGFEPDERPTDSQAGTGPADSALADTSVAPKGGGDAIPGLSATTPPGHTTDSGHGASPGSPGDTRPFNPSDLGPPARPGVSFPHRR